MNKQIKLAIFLIFLLIFLSLITRYSGHTDVQEYASVSKFFSGLYKADIRTSHSMLFGFLHSPLISLFRTQFVMKITSLIFLISIIASVYYISGKNQKALFLILLSPIVWYTGPWINPISLSSLFFLWGYFFLKKYDKTNNLPALFCSGLFLGLAWLFWNTAIFILAFLTICFFLNKKFCHLLLFLFAVLFGLLPLLIFDQILYGMFFYSILKHLFGNVAVSLYGSIYSGLILKTKSLLPVFLFVLMMPLFSFTLYKIFKEEKKTLIFLMLTFLFFLMNSQIRYIILFYPILILLLSKTLSPKQFKIQIIIFLLLTIIVINPYIFQVKNTTNTPEFSFVFKNFGNWKIIEDKNKLMQEDLDKIAKEYPNQVFLVGNKIDDYAILAYLYWGNKVKEFVSIQDYDFHFQNKKILFEKTLISKPKIADRRQIWISGGIGKSEADNTNYEEIQFAIGINEPIDTESFELIKKYSILYLSKKI